jgi:glucosamine-phosphate N-acetyltransferase
VERRIVASASQLVEWKLIHSCGKVAHIEDVVVSRQERGMQLGACVVAALMQCAVALGCYKVILNCTPQNVAFYRKLGFAEKEKQMAWYAE